MMKRPLRFLLNRVPPGQFLRYLAVGAWNTGFGYGTFALFTWLLDEAVPHAYIAAFLLSNMVSITVAFLGYKWFVFKTKGNYLREWSRCVAVYSGGLLAGLALLPVLVALIRQAGYVRGAPYAGGALVMGITVVASFLGHKHISFRKGNSA